MVKMILNLKDIKPDMGFECAIVMNQINRKGRTCQGINRL